MYNTTFRTPLPCSDASVSRNWDAMKTIPWAFLSVRTLCSSTFQCTVLRMEASYFSKKNCLACIVHNHQAPGTSVSEKWAVQRATSRPKHYAGRGQWYKRRFNWQYDDSRTLGGAVHTGCMMEQQKSASPYAGRMEGYERDSLRISRTDRLKKKNWLPILYEKRDSAIVFCPHWLNGRTKTSIVHLIDCISSQSEVKDLCPQGIGIGLSWYSDGLRVGRPGFGSLQCKIFLLSPESRPALGPNQPPIQCVLVPILLGCKAAGAWCWPLTSI
jgi:hypothetical protein